jgi:hypothetical protein
MCVLSGAKLANATVYWGLRILLLTPLWPYTTAQQAKKNKVWSVFGSLGYLGFSCLFV